MSDKQEPKDAKPESKKAEPLRFADKVEHLQQELEAAEAKLTEANEKAQANMDKALRAMAEVENMRSRTKKEVEDAHKFAIDKFANSLLPVIDSMEKALEVPSEHEEVLAMKKGVELTLKMFVDSVAKFGLEQVNPIGETFDPEKHEAMSMIEDANYESNEVLQVYQTGYMLNGRLIRPARVVVNK